MQCESLSRRGPNHTEIHTSTMCYQMNDLYGSWGEWQCHISIRAFRADCRFLKRIVNGIIPTFRSTCQNQQRNQFFCSSMILVEMILSHPPQSQCLTLCTITNSIPDYRFVFVFVFGPPSLPSARYFPPIKSKCLETNSNGEKE